jgi:hypothetical protein
VLILLAAPLLAATLSARDAHTVLADVKANIERYYVVPERRAEIARALADAEATGRYATSDPGVLADRITTDLLAASQDRHLALVFDHAEYTSLTAEEPEEETPAPVPATPSYESARARLRNSGIETMAILGGNVRLVRLTNFLWSEETSADAIAGAIRFLRDADAIIIDLRGNGGGTGTAVQQLISAFIEPRTLLLTFVNTLNDDTHQVWSLDHVEGGRLTGKPLYVLIDGATGSAAEEFAYHVQQFHLGTLIGETTAGAGYTTAHLPIAPSFVLRISAGRPIHGVSKGSWEGTGVVPDLARPSISALDEAHLLALENLLQTAPDEAARVRYRWGLEGLRGALAPPRLSPTDLPQYAGEFEGERIVALSKGSLTISRAGGRPIPLLPLSTDLFAYGLAENVRVRFARRGDAVVALEMLYPDREGVSAQRVR